MAVARRIMQGDGEETVVVVGDAVHIVEQYRDGFFQCRLVGSGNGETIAAAVTL
ncbi:hypothetical protein [Xanthomonas euvesicatoria]|uniref:hypothetical protein n=1 Tax=Xanthomonas euvesicatoria TaxID=456327 RepID=UPI000247CFEA|nr:MULTISPECIES: hypothetical protein [Xanthomonas]MBE0316769.1 hypothetical protein [Xanthomonas citri pv. punicae]CCF70701.1 hypothetical protein XAPC_4438 [Xanthomonas citri pv. punicae str. LMG 859]